MTRIRNRLTFTWFCTAYSRAGAHTIVRALQAGGNHAFYEEGGTMFLIFTRVRKPRP